MRLAVAVIFIASVGCSMNQPNADLSPLVVTRGFIPAPAGGGFGGPTWWPASEEIVVLYDPPGQRRLSSLDLYGLAPDGSRMRRLPLPTVPDCVSTIHLVPQVLPDGRLAYVEHCIGTNPRVPLHASRLMALDARTGRVEPLIPYGFHANMALYAFSPDQQRWIINDGQSLFESLEWLEADGPRRIDLPLERAGAPTWSPDGALIAVAGAPKGQSAQGVDRLDLSQRLYVFSPNDLKLRALAEGLRPRTVLTEYNWSPDSHWLVGPFTRSDKSEGLYIVEVSSGRAYLVLAGKQSGDATWMPDGRRLLVSVGVDSHEPILLPGQVKADQVGVLIIELPDLNSIAAGR